MLQAGGGQYRLSKALGGAEALAHLRREPVDLVLLDWSMPEVNGLAVMQAMKTIPTLADIPVIVISGEYSEAATLSAGLDLRLIRSGQASVSEIVNYLEALVGVLPPAEIPASEAARLSPATQADQPVS
jgi:CheY-like chemotaxis protein